VLRELPVLPTLLRLEDEDDEPVERVEPPVERVLDDEDELTPLPLREVLRVLLPEVRPTPEVVVPVEPRRVALEGL
jgi:hypothetical protein